MALRKSIVNRFRAVSLFIAAMFLFAMLRLICIVTVEREAWLAEVKKLQRSDMPIKPERGNMYDAKGNLITATIPYYSLYMDLGVEYLDTKKGKELYRDNIDSLCICLSRKLGDKSPQEYKQMINTAYLRNNRNLRLYKGVVSYIDLMEIKKFPLFRAGRNCSGFIAKEMANRENLYGSLASRTIGDIYGSGGRGRFGLELAYDSLLAGEEGLSKGHLVGTGHWVFVEEKAPVKGADIYTTIDVEMQDIAETALRSKLEEVNAKSGCLVLMEVKTGEIKAMVNLQRTPNGYDENFNMAVADMSEPGSTFKTMSLMVALDHGVCDTADVYDLNHGSWMFRGVEMTDHNKHRGGYDSLSVSGILAQSSNVGVSRIIDENYRKDPMKFIDAVVATGFAEQIEIGVPGIGKPKIPTPKSKQWSGTALPWMSIGYEVLVPQIYTLNFYNAISNGGKMMRPYLVREIRRDNSVVVKNKPEVVNSSICKSSTLKKVQGMLEGVVENGTAKIVRSKVFSIAGKTGTIQIKTPAGLRYQVSFCGYFPAEEPLYSCIVVIKEPALYNPSAGALCGVVFKKVAERIYAQTIDKEIEELVKWEGDSIEPYNLPRVKTGARVQVEDAMDKLDLDYQHDKSEWISVSKSKEYAELVSNKRAVLDNLVPNVIGMGAIDAVYLLESCGMHVQMYGKGRVVQQSIPNGQNVVKGSTIVLTLR